MFSKSEFSVKRRFSDFLGLHSKLASKYLHVGYIVPPAPEKSIVGKYEFFKNWFLLQLLLQFYLYRFVYSIIIHYRDISMSRDTEFKYSIYNSHSSSEECIANSFTF